MSGEPPVTVVMAGAALWREILERLQDGGDVEYFDLVDIARDAGLIREEEYDPDKHGDEGHDADPGDLIWFLTPLGEALRDEGMERPKEKKPALLGDEHAKVRTVVDERERKLRAEATHAERARCVAILRRVEEYVAEVDHFERREVRRDLAAAVLEMEGGAK